MIVSNDKFDVDRVEDMLRETNSCCALESELGRRKMYAISLFDEEL